MNNIVFKDLIQFVDFVRTFDKKLGVGMEGTCYKKDDKTYKLYNHSYRDNYDNSKSQENLLKFRDIHVDNFYFIRSLIFIRSSIVGSVSKYADGKTCSKIYLHRRNLDDLINALNLLKKNIMDLSRKHIYINEFWLENILYDGIKFSFIDTGAYYFQEDSGDDVTTIYRKNITTIMKYLFKSITNFTSSLDNFIFAYLNEINSEYKDYLEDADLMINPDETIIGIRNVIQEGIGREITTFSDCRRELLRIRKK